MCSQAKECTTLFSKMVSSVNYIFLDIVYKRVKEMTITSVN